MGYKETIESIKQLNWPKLKGEELQQLMLLSYASALEFAQALRIAQALYPEDKKLRQTCEGELQTDNLHYEGYAQQGDHADFLKYFITKNSIRSNHQVEFAIKIYLETCASFDQPIRAMSIFSREEELSNIFEHILEAKDWAAPGLPAFKYYLQRHIILDQEVGGHHDLTKHFPVDEDVASFYEARLNMYRAIPALFHTTQ